MIKEKKIVYADLPESRCIINEIKSRYAKGKYTLGVFAGEPGTGKSSSCHRCAEILSYEIYGCNNITNANFCNDLAEMWEFVLSHMDGTGGIMIAEELSVLFPSVRATSSDNLSAQKLLDTCRKFRIIILGNAPIWKLISGSLRTHAHMYIETLKIIKNQEVVIYKMFKLQTNYYSGKVYMKKFRINGLPIRRGYFKKPNEKIWAVYEEDKIESAKRMYQIELAKKKARMDKETKELRTYISSVNDNDLNQYNALPDKQRDYAKFMATQDMNIPKTIRIQEIAKHFNVSTRAIQDGIKRIKDKHINLNW